MPPVPLTTIGDAAAELGFSRTALERRLRRLDFMPTVRIPHTPTARGFTPDEMKRLREMLRPAAVAASA